MKWTICFINTGNNISRSFVKEKPKCNHPHCIYEFYFQPIDSSKILKHFTNLASNSNLDVLDFDTKLLKLAAPYIAQSLCVIFNASQDTVIVPDDWKIARTTPIFKGKGSTNEGKQIIDQFRLLVIFPKL